MNELCDANRSTLVVIDLQERLLPKIHDGENVLDRVELLTDAARLLEIPIVGTEQNPAGLGPSMLPLGDSFDSLITKTHFDAFAEFSSTACFEPQRDEVIVVGCEAHVCVLQSVLGLLRHDYRVHLVADAIGSRKAQDKSAAIERARDAGASVVTSEMVMFEWLRHCEHPAFRAVLELLK
ncbi:isochorismatase family protein [Modicisalibacter ilicicola]|uniref:isochorismatase family protein n=1 Tax=Modicisalibacter ilicicola TaxID=480814 RepID=UPI0009339C49|nr:isochorismatase family protein [Halomonas ilicicola]